MKGARKNPQRQERTTVRMIRMLGERLSAVGDAVESVETSPRERLREFLDGMLPREQKAREHDERKTTPASSTPGKVSTGSTRRAAVVAHDFRTAR